MGSIPPGEMANQLQVHALTIDDDKNNAHCSVTIPFTLNSNGMVFIRLNKSTCESSLVHHRRYKTIISAKNDLGTTNSTGEILFSKSNYYAYNYQGQCGKALSISVLFKRCIFCGFPQKLCSANMRRKVCPYCFCTQAYSGLCSFHEAPPTGSFCQ